MITDYRLRHSTIAPKTIAPKLLDPLCYQDCHHSPTFDASPSTLGSRGFAHTAQNMPQRLLKSPDIESDNPYSGGVREPPVHWPVLWRLPSLRTSRAKRIGAGTMAGRRSTSAKVRVNSRLVTGSGATTLRGPSTSRGVHDVIDRTNDVIDPDPAHPLRARSDLPAKSRSKNRQAAWPTLRQPETAPLQISSDAIRTPAFLATSACVSQARQTSGKNPCPIRASFIQDVRPRDHRRIPLQTR